MCILGDMKELGEASNEEHQKIVDMLPSCGFEEVWLVGDEFGKTSHPDSYRMFANVDEAKAAIADKQPQGHVILIKGSNSTHLVQTVELL